MTQAGQPGNPGDYFYGTPPHDGPAAPRAHPAEPAPAPVYAAQQPVTPPEYVAAPPQVAAPVFTSVHGQTQIQRHAQDHAQAHTRDHTQGQVPGHAQSHAQSHYQEQAAQPAAHTTAPPHAAHFAAQPTAYSSAHSDEPSDLAGRPPVSGAVNLLGAVTSIALVLGLGIWGYKLAVRDVSGVPVIQAQSGPMRIQPENPGGQLAVHSGLSVNAVQAEGTAEPTADRLVLAPNPVDVIAADEAGLDLAALQGGAAERPTDQPTVQSQAAAQEGQVAAIAAAVAEAEADSEVVNSDADAGSLAENQNPGAPTSVNSVSSTISAPEAIDLASVSLPATDDAKPALEILPASVPGTVKSLRPLTRPGGFQALVDAQLAAKAEAQAAQQAAADKAAADQAAQATAATATATATASQLASATPETVADTAVDPIAAALSEANALPEVPASDVVAGTNLAHLGPFDSPELARKEWVKLAARFEGALEGKSLVVQEAQSGGRDFYRLLAMGFDDISAARNFCSALVAENAACIPMVLR